MSFVRTVLFVTMAMPTLMMTDVFASTESEATAVISFAKRNSVRISGLNDINLGTRSNLASSVRQMESVCVYSSTGAYTVTATSLNGTFELRSEDTLDAILYRLQWVSSGTQDLLPAVALGGLLGHASDIDCAGNLNASIQIIVSASSFNRADPGVYTDTLMLLVRAE